MSDVEIWAALGRLALFQKDMLGENKRLLELFEKQQIILNVLEARVNELESEAKSFRDWAATSENSDSWRGTWKPRNPRR